MSDPERFASLMSEFRSVDRSREPERARQILQEAAGAIDRDAEPKKWAAMRGLFGQLSENVDPRAAISAYRDALSVWRKETDRESWVACHSGIGTLLGKVEPFGPGQMEEAIASLEQAVDDQPFLAALLAVYFRFRAIGDAADNWRKRVHYLELAQGQIARDLEPAKWARGQNELGAAYSEEPDGEFPRVMEKRLECHRAALDALGASPGADWIETCLSLSECYLFRPAGDPAENFRLAERYARDALAACGTETAADLAARARLALARVCLGGDRDIVAESVRQALELVDEAAGLIGPDASPALLATVESFRANAYAKLIRSGEPHWLDALVRSSEAAVRLLDPQFHQSDQRSILQVEGEALLDAGDHVRAAGCLQRAVDAADACLAQSRTVAGRMQRIWEFRDSSALLSFCQLKLGRTQEALATLDRGKSRFWQTGDQPEAVGDWAEFVPKDGALLFANFAAREGAVVAVTGSGTEVVQLPQFGNARLMELQRGGQRASELGGWLKAYNFRNSRPDAWRREIDDIGRILYEELWRPVLTTLQAMGVSRGAELVWFSQGGSGVFPMHAAWRLERGTGSEGPQRRWLIEDYAIRYAPSARALSAGARNVAAAGPTLVVSNPMGDLAFSELEAAWVRQSVGDAGVRILHGDAASLEAVLAALPEAGAAHFSTHALFDLERPLQSRVLLAGQKWLTLEELLPVVRGHAPERVILSACETGVTRVTITPDEFLGFPTAFLYAGTRTVLATLWPVDDAAAAALVGCFYRELSGGKRTAAEALRRAQDWLRTVTVRELMELLRGLKEEPPPAGPLAARVRTQLRAVSPQAQPFGEPYYWAAFALSGR